MNYTPVSSKPSFTKLSCLANQNTSFFVAVTASLMCAMPTVFAQSYTEWTGSGNNWNTSANWNPNSTPNNRYGQLEWKGNGSSTTNNDLSSLSMWRLYMSGTKAYTFTGNSVNLFDNSSNHSWLLSDSTVTQTFSTLDVNFAATAGPNFGQISARSTGDLILNNIGITGSQVAQLRVAGQSTGRVIFGGIISGSGKSVSIGVDETGGIRTSTDVIYRGANTYSGDTFINAGSLSFDTNGSANNSVLRLGDTSGANSSTLRLINATGGQTINTVINPRAGGSGTLTVSSQNTSGTNTLSNHIGLDRGVSITQSAGGSLNITQARSGVTTDTGTDLKSFTLTLTSAANGQITHSGTIYNSTGSGSVVASGAGTVTLSGANTYEGSTSVTTGTLLVNNSSGSGTGSGTVSVSSGANLGGTGTISGATTVSGNLNAGNGGTAVGRLTFSSSLSLSGAQTTTFNLAATGTRGTNYDAVDVSGALTNGGALNLNFGTAFLGAGVSVFDLFAFGSQTSSFSTVSITNGYSVTLANTLGTWSGTSGSSTFSFVQSTGDLTVTTVPEPSTWLGAGLLTGLAIFSQRRRWQELVS